MKSTPLILALAFSVVLADPAMAQTRAKDDSRRSTPRETATTTDRNERRTDRVRETARPQPIRQNVTVPRPRDDDRPRYDDRDRWGRRLPVIILRPDRYGYDRYGYDRYNRYGYDRYGYGSVPGHGYASGRVWNRHGAMSCVRLDDELEWAHDEWHYRNDRDRNLAWYDEEHARLEWRIADERAVSDCGRPRVQRECEERGRYPLTDSSSLVAVEVLDILLGSGRWHGRH